MPFCSWQIFFAEAQQDSCAPRTAATHGEASTPAMPIMVVFLTAAMAAAALTLSYKGSVQGYCLCQPCSPGYATAAIKEL